MYVGSCTDILPRWEADQFHMCVTSPPYLALRNYGGESSEVDWPALRYRQVPGGPDVQVPQTRCALGSEADPAQYVGHLVAVFREVRRVLRPDGLLWLNLGDSYSGGSRGSSYQDPKQPGRASSRLVSEDSGNLLGIPWRAALALQADGWFLRSDVVLRRRAPVPESVSGWIWVRCRRKVLGDSARACWEACPGCPRCQAHEGWVLRRGSWRPTRSYEHAFLLARSAEYFVDGSLAQEQTRAWRVTPVTGHTRAGQPRRLEQGEARARRNPRDVLDLPPLRSRLRHSAMMPPSFAAWCLARGPAATCASCGAPQVTWGGRLRPTCPCACGSVPPRVLDPFMGAGTVAAAAEMAGWHWAGCELSAEYADLLPARRQEVARLLGKEPDPDPGPGSQLGVAGQRAFGF